MRKTSFLVLFTLLQAALMLSCSSSDDNNSTGNIVSIAETEVQLEADETYRSVDITTRQIWNATLDETGKQWLELEKAKGNGGKTEVAFSCSKNTTKNARQGNIIVTCGSEKVTIKVTQAASETEILNSSDIKDYDKYYKPKEFAKMDMLSSDSKWSFTRMKQSEHFFVFWESGFGDDPNSDDVPSSLRVDIDDLLKKAEQFYTTNITKLQMAVTDKGVSQLDNYKMEIYLLYQTEWLATGGGYDDVIGALWVNPSTCQPVGSTIAHEIGHSFQYQVYCDKLLNGGTNDYGSGFRYEPGGGQGCCFWEQCAQWQSYQDYPEQAIDNYHFSVWMSNHHRHFEHEWQRYASYWLQYYWQDKHGDTALGRVWNESASPEDAIGAYMRIFCNNSYDVMKKELFEYAQKCVTYDFNAVKSYVGTQYESYSTKLYSTGDGYYQVAYSNCPSSTGFNVIPLEVPTSGTTVTVDFTGLAAGSALAEGDPGTQIDGDGKTVGNTTTYNNVGKGEEGWAYGFVALLNNGTRVYGDMYETQGTGEGQATYTVPSNVKKLWLVVQGTPKSYRLHAWDEKESNDDQWPYKIKVSGTDIAGYFAIDTTKDPTDVEFTYNLTCDASSSEYLQGTINLQDNGDIKTLAQAFVMEPSVLSGYTSTISANSTGTPEEGKVVLGLLQPDGTINYSYTANAGFYCTAEGNQGSWSNSDPLWFEYDKDNFIITYGQYPGKTTAGTTYTIKPVLVYTKNGVQYKATFVLNMQY